MRRVLAKQRLILDEMCHLCGKLASYLRRVLCKTRLIFPRINGPNVLSFFAAFHEPNQLSAECVSLCTTKTIDEILSRGDN